MLFNDDFNPKKKLFSKMKNEMQMLIERTFFPFFFGSACAFFSLICNFVGV